MPPAPRKRWLAAGLGVALAAGAAVAGTSLVVLPTPRIAVTITGPTETVAMRSSQWTFEVKNLGREIADLGIRFDGGDGWTSKHDIGYGTSRCSPTTADATLRCGPLRSSETMTTSLIARPRAEGAYSFTATFFDRGGAHPVELFGPDAPQFMLPGSALKRYVQAWTEKVAPEPVLAVTVTDVHASALAGAVVSIPGSPVVAVTGSSGVARLGLGALEPGTYTVEVAGDGYVSTRAQVGVSATGDPPPISIELPLSAGQLEPGSDPGVLPAPVLIADEDNDRLLEVSPTGQVLWEFPRPGDLAPGQTFLKPDDAFFTPDGTQIIATQEENFAVSLIDIATHKIVWRYGEPGVPGSGPNRLWNPDDAMVMPNGDVVISDIINCRLVVIAAGQHDVARSYGRIRSCRHNPPAQFASPNGAFPLRDGNWLITEITGDWVTEMAPGGHVLWATHPPGVAYPSDSNEISPGRYITVDYSYPGQVVIFDSAGRTLWRYRPLGALALNHPSLGVGLPNGDVLVNDDYNDRVIVIDPRSNRVVWQYGKTGHEGTGPGFLSNPDGVDLAPPYSLLGTLASSLRSP